MDGEPDRRRACSSPRCATAPTSARSKAWPAPRSLHPVQQAFVNRSALQCGICMPGHVMAACALLEKNPQPTDEEIQASVDSVYCRCTGYVRIDEAYREAIRLMRKTGLR